MHVDVREVRDGEGHLVRADVMRGQQLVRQFSTRHHDNPVHDATTWAKRKGWTVATQAELLAEAEADDEDLSHLSPDQRRAVSRVRRGGRYRDLPT